MNTKKKSILLLAGAVLMAANPMTALADEDYDPNLGNPNSTNTNIVSVDTRGRSSDVTIDGNTIHIRLNYLYDAYPKDPEEFEILVEDDDKTYEVPAGSLSINGSPGFFTRFVRDHDYAKVEDMNTDDGGRTWTFTVRAADKETTEDYTIYVEPGDIKFDCEHDSWKWVPENLDGHVSKCSVCGNIQPGVDFQDHDWVTIEEGYTPTYEQPGLMELRHCSVCDGYSVFSRYRREERMVEEGEDLDAARRDPSFNEIRAERGVDPMEDTPSIYHNRPDKEVFLEEWEQTQDTAQAAVPAESANSQDNGVWLQDSTGWWFKRNDGSYPAGMWQECTASGKSGWYHFDVSGYMNHGWLNDSDGNVYYLCDTANESYGAMMTGWQWIDGKCYYFNSVSGANGLPYGAMYRNTVTPDGYTVNDAGQWTIGGVVQTQ